MIIFPAIDLRNGRVVRLRQGRAEDEIIYSDDPVQIATKWQGEGAEWLHIVNLDGALGADTATNSCALKKILAAVSIPTQFGGGLRDLANIDTAFRLGVSRIVIGTAAIKNPILLSDALARYGAERVVVGIDTRAGMAATHGWREQSSISALDLAQQMHGLGITRIVYTDIARDGMLRGINADVILELARATGMHVIASGGVATLRDVENLARAPQCIEGVIIGQALYTGVVNLKEAIEAASRRSSVILAHDSD